MDTRDKNRQRRRPAGARGAATQAARRRKEAPKQPAPEVVYTQPGPFNRNRFLLRLATAAAVVLALLFGMSIFFKVKNVEVSGTNKYTAWDIMEASGIQEGENLLTISEPKISSNITSKLPYVKKVRVGIKLPDTVKIEIEELDVVYAVEAEDGSWWLMRADGGIVEQISSADAGLYTKVLGVQLTAPAVGEQAAAYQPSQTDENGETVPVTVLAGEQLDTAITIVQYLESNSIIGEAASVDVSDLSDLQIWYGTRFQITLGDTTQLSYKIGLVKTAIDEYMQDYDSGILDVSMTIQPDPEQSYQVIYTPFTD